MDGLRGLCSKIDLDSIRAKFQHMPTMAAMPAIKLPKSMPKLKSRKIFRTSRENVNKATTPKQTSRPTSLSLRPPAPKPAEFINHTPTRISTISSLMQQHTTSESTRRSSGRCLETDDSLDSNTYRSAHRIDDDYPSPKTLHNTLYDDSPPYRSPVRRGGGDAAKTNSPQVSESKNSAKMSLGEKLQKSYKDLTEFRFKNLLAKKTVVRSDNIMVDYYVQRYEEDRDVEEREQKRRDREIAENYRFKFKETRQSSIRSYSMSPFDSPITQRIKSQQSLRRLSGKATRTVSEQSGDESGMEITPPRRGSKRSRFPRGRSEGSMSDGNELDEVPIQAPISSSLWAIKEKQIEMERSQSHTTLNQGHKERMRRLTSYISSHDESGAESTNDAASEQKKQSKLQKFTRHRRVDDEEPNATGKSEESLDKAEATNKPLDAFKKNLKRFKSTISIKRPTPTEHEDDTPKVDKMERSATSPTLTRGEKLTARLRRFKTREVASIDEDEHSPQHKKPEQSNTGSPLRAAIANKLQTWKKSFKRKPDESVNTGDEASPEKQNTRTSTFKDKLRYIRSRKNPNSNDEQEAADTEGTTTDTEQKPTKSTSNLEEKFANARQRTLKRVNDKMQKIKFFHKSQEGQADNGVKSGKVAAKPESVVVFKRRAISHDGDDEGGHSSESDIEEIEPHRNDDTYSYASSKKVHAVWTTKPILTDSTESEDNDTEYPRVVIHQDESDLFESTLIIAVTTAAAVPATPPSPTPKITEITTKTPPKVTPTRPKALDWKAKDNSGGFSESLSPNEDSNKSGWIAPPTVRAHARKLSMDSNSDSDSWIADTIHNKNLSTTLKEETRRTSATALNSIDENEEPWRVHSLHPEEKIYRPQSIDIFADNIKQAAFEGFDDELKDQPVLKIVRKSNSEGSFGKYSSDDADTADDDNSSRITKVRVQYVSEETQLLRRSRSPEPISIEERQSWQIGNSRESLDANFDENEEYSEDDDDYDEDDDRPPSTAPSPPPMSPPPPPLPQRQPSVRLSKSVPVPLEEILLPPLPPLPATRPPVRPTVVPPKIPERTESMARIAKPLVKTSSLRLAYSEQVKPADVGKVNKLISKFEQPSSFEQHDSPHLEARHRVRQRAVLRYETEDYSDYDDDFEENDDVQTFAVNEKNNNKQKLISEPCNVKQRHEITPTAPRKLEAPQPPMPPHELEVEEDTKRITKKRIAPQPDTRGNANTTKTHSTTTTTTLNSTSARETKLTSITNLDAENNKTELLLDAAVLEMKIPKTNNLYTGEYSKTIPTLTLTPSASLTDIILDNNNSQMQTQSKPSSEYGSPLEYPSSLIGSTETTPTPGRRHQKELRTSSYSSSTGSQRRGRSMVRDDDQYYSFDSDEENSYYSISSTGSSRYVVEI